MSTQRRVVPWQRFAYTEKINTELAGTEDSASPDAGVPGSKKQFRRVALGLTAELATNSLGLSSCCEWNFRNTACGFFFQEADTNGSSPAFVVRQAGILPKQLPPISPLLSGASELEECSAQTKQSALPRVPTSICRGTERQYGQGNLYLKHAARNAACNFGRRSALGDLLRAGK